MAKYSVRLRVTGYAIVEVEATDPKAAIAAAAAEAGAEHLEEWDVTKEGADVEEIED